MSKPLPLRAESLVAGYGGTPILSGVSLRLEAGVHALQGANGSGKSTLLRLLAGVLSPHGGSIWVYGNSMAAEPLAARRCLSYVPDDTPVYPFLTGRELLRFVAAAKRARLGRDIDALAEAFGLSSHLDQKFDALSLATGKKMLLCAAWIGDPRLMLMDEPSNGLDASARDQLATRLRAAAASGAAVLCATHDAAFIAATGAWTIRIEEIGSLDRNPSERLFDRRPIAISASR